MDYFQKFKEQQQTSESLFRNLFSKTGKTQTQATANPDFYQTSNGTFMFGDKSTAKEVNTPALLPYLKTFNWKDSKLGFMFLPGTEFHADKINFDLNTQTISFFKGTWESGPFFGEIFQGVFRGSSFQGKFSGPYSDYESHPTTFIDGLFYDTTNKGILGMPNTITLNNAKNRKFNIITIPAGYYLQFRSVNGISGYIKMIKRLDYTDSTFQMEIMDGFTGQKTPRIISLPWNYFRQNWKFLEINPKNPRNIGGLIHVPDGDYVKEMYISAAPAMFTTPAAGQVQFDPEKKYSFDLEKIPYLKIKSIKGDDGNFTDSKAEFKFDSPQEFEQFTKIVSYINSGTLSQDIKNIAKAVKYGEVDGYGQFKYLSQVFNQNAGHGILQGKRKGGLAEAPKGNIGGPKFQLPGEVNKTKSNNPTGYYANKKRKPKPVSYTVSEPIEKTESQQFGTIPSMQRLNDFIKYFVENIVDSEGEPKKTVQDLIVSRLKTALGTDVVPKPETATAKPEPGMGDSEIPLMTEAIRSKIRNIINDSF